MRYIEDNFHNGKKFLTSLLFLIILLGVVLGIWIICTKPDLEYLHSPILTHGFLKDYSQKTLLEVFLTSFKWTGLLLVIIYICGYSAISQPLNLAIIFYRGIALGISIGSTYLMYSKGILIYLLVMMFNIIVSSVVLVFSSIDALKLSNTILYTILERSSDAFRLKKYNLKFLMYLIITILSSIADTCLLYLFIDRLYS